MSDTTASRGDAWEEHYRGLTLHVDADGEVWWQQYNGEQRLFLSDPPATLVEAILDVKPQGGRIRVTEQNDVIAKVEQTNGTGYDQVYIDQLTESQTLQPDGEPEYAIELHPTDIDRGELWPSVYDGTRFSLSSTDRIWWHNPETKRRHQVSSGIPDEIVQAILAHKRQGGSFRVTPWGDVITLISAIPDPGAVKAQFAELPRVVQNIIQLRNDRGLEMLPVYVGSIVDNRVEIEEPRSLTDELDDSAWDDIEDWIDNLGPTASAADGIDETESESAYDDDPEEWATDTVEQTADDV
ncbi:hypothetical protein [Halorubrum sp. DTA98]|uniref:hypothetical protein n=1 Tax=Halorubrum sp. DTA98 TaxID=3402163 RepID=UPI003AAAFCB0